MDAHNVFSQLLQELRFSNLHFILTETPYSAQIMLRKRFLKGSEGTAAPTSLQRPLKQECDEFNAQNNLLKSENAQLQVEMQVLQDSVKSMKETIVILENKTAKAEDSAMKLFEDKNHETIHIKNTLKNLQSDFESAKKELNMKNKTIKEKNNEIYKLDQKCENLSDNVKKLKLEMSRVKQENKKLIKQKPAKSKTYQHSSTATIPIEVKNGSPSTTYPKEITSSLSSLSSHSSIKFDSKTCTHSPQCTLREPTAPPEGPPTLDHFRLSQLINSMEDMSNNNMDDNTMKESSMEDNNMKDNSMRNNNMEEDINIRNNNREDSIQEMIRFVKEITKNVEKII